MTPEALERIRQGALAELAREPVARPWWKDALLLAGVNGVALVACSLALGSRPDLTMLGGPALALLLGAPLVALAVAGAVAAIRPGRLGAVTAALVLGGVGAVAVLAAGHLAGGHAHAEGETFLGAGWPCFATQVASAVVPSLAALIVLARFAFQPLRMFAAALSAGAAGVFALHLHCPIGAPSHLVLFHLLPWAGVGLVAVVARRFVRQRSSAP